ncbi:rhomboid family intramembrane serine protease [Candidatus Bathyarchaeota archaeon]|nr:rhomboid family intramembrane serine protease [Candidatus Bathyarchaeota archaeon]
MGLGQWSKNEKIILFLGVPLVIFLIYLVPSNIKDAYFVLNKNNVSVLSMFLSNYTHTDFWHLAANVSVYLIVIYLIFKFETNKSSFYKTIAFLLLILPFIVSVITVIYVPALNSQGFSGIVAGSFGYFMYVTYRHIKDTWKLNADISFISLLLFINVFLGVASYGLTNNSAFAAVLFVLTIGLLLYNRNLLKSIIILLINKHKELNAQHRLLISDYLTFILALVVLFSLHSLIQVTVQNGSVANAIGHYAGYVAGIGFPMLVIETKIWK